MFQFPANPVPGQVFTPTAGVTYRWSGVAWYLIAGPGAFITQAEADLRYVNVDEVQNLTNRIINGKFAIDQRNAGAAVTANSQYGPDRWKFYINQPPATLRMLPQPVGLQFTVTTADSTVDAGDITLLGQVIEGVNIADFALGTAAASPFTVAFEFWSNIPATYMLSFRNLPSTRSYIVPFTVVTGWQTVRHTVPGETTGVWATNNSAGMDMSITVNAGSTFTAGATANTWMAADKVAVAGTTNMMAAVNNQIYLANVRLYKGSVDFGPDRRLYAEELALCQRYYCKSFPLATVPAQNSGVNEGAVVTPAIAAGNDVITRVEFPVDMRAVPTVTLFNPNATNAQFRNHIRSTDCANSTGFFIGTNGMSVTATAPAGSFAGDSCKVHFTASAEL